MATLVCSECGGEVDKIGNLLRCRKCRREKKYTPYDSGVHEVDLNEDTKDHGIILE